RLLGQTHDEETGLCYVRYRYFDPRTARFLSPDPLEILGGRNLFGFDGSPTTSVDPLGLSCLVIGDPARDNAIAYAIANIRPEPGKYVVVVHGTPTQVAILDESGRWSSHNPDYLISVISAAGNYRGEGLIQLNACNPGRIPNGVGQQLSLAYPNA